MKKYKPKMSFNEDTANRYDDSAIRGDEAETVAVLEQLARGGPALELAIGTGRIGLPLSNRGIGWKKLWDFFPGLSRQV